MNLMNRLKAVFNSKKAALNCEKGSLNLGFTALNSLKVLTRAIFCLVFFSVCFFALLNLKPVKADILSAIFPNDAKNALASLTSRSSNSINLIIEADDPFLLSLTKDEILNSLPENFSFRSNFKETPEMAALFDFYKAHPMNFLSDKDFKLLSENKTDEVKNNALNSLYSPFSPAFLPLSKDPYFLLSNFITSLANAALDADCAEYNGKYYSLIPLVIKKNLPQKVQNASMKELGAIVKNFNKKNEGAKAYLSGVLAHSYYTALKSAVEINIISILSFAFVFFLCFSYFKTSKLLIPICANILLGFLFAFCATSLVFSEVHIFAFVFSTAMIGICIDYSLHYFIEPDVSKILKSLTVSLFTTVFAFLILYFSNLFLLKQIAVFTVSALIFTYFSVLLFYPLLPQNFRPHPENSGFNGLLPSKYFNKKYPSSVCRCVFLTVFLILILGCLNLKFEDDIKSMYAPKGSLLKAEAIYSNVFKNLNPKGYILISGQNFDDLIKNEEKITPFLNTTSYISLSKFFPSKERQQANFSLVLNFYKKELNSLPYLSKSQKDMLLGQKYSKTLTVSDFLGSFADEFLIKNSSPASASSKTAVILLFSPLNKEVLSKIQKSDVAKFIDPPSEISFKIKDFRQKTLLLLPLIFAFVLIFLIFIYGPKQGVKIFVPPLFGAILPVSILSLFNQHINLFHILGVILILGFSLDYSIFRASGIKKTNDAVLISCATTVFSFAMLSITSFKLISSLGFVLAVGVLSSYILSLLLISDKPADDTAAI